MSTNHRAVVIGCGNVGAQWGTEPNRPQPASHAAALKANERTELVGLVDQDPVQLKKVGEFYGVATYVDAAEALSALKPDLVVVATPPSTHEALFKIAVDAGVRLVICEKPLSDTLEAAQRMTDLIKSSPVLAMVNHQRRYAPLFRAAKERIKQGELGDIQQVSAYYTNGLLNNGTHTIDTLRFLLQDEVAWVIGIENKINTVAPAGGLNIDGLIGFTKGTTVSLQSLNNDAYILHDFSFYGTKGLLEIHKYGFRFEWTPANVVTLPGIKELDWDSTQVSLESGSMIAGTTAHAVECLDGATPEGSIEDGYKTMQVLQALLESAKQGGVKISI